MTKLLETLFPRKKTRVEIIRESLTALRDTPEARALALATEIAAFEKWQAL